MKIAVMQPYLFPYIGYFQLIAAVDKLVVYDDVNFIKKGWINRNYILINETKSLFTIPLQNASQNKLIKDTRITEETGWQEKFLRSIAHNYKKTPFFDETFDLVERVVLSGETFIAKMIVQSLELLKAKLELETEIIATSTIYDNQELKAQHRILDICKRERASQYVNPGGGVELYNRELFRANGIELHFLKTQPFSYQQHGGGFVPYLSIIDVLMFNGFTKTRNLLPKYDLD